MIIYPTIRSLMSLLENVEQSAPRKFDVHISGYVGDLPPTLHLPKAFVIEMVVDGDDIEDALRNEIKRVVGYEPQEIRWWELHAEA